ncbi:MAG: tetratricopeptide repeat protein [Anaerolineae bacterium]|nr:tetratricopeptide repeat protein [Anaerolineae bacterium]
MSIIPPNAHPSPEFMERAVAFMQQWERGELNNEQILEPLNALLAEAVVAGRVADQAQAHTMIGVVYSYSGKPDIGIQHYRTARHFFEKVGNTERMLIADTNIAETLMDKGDLPRARELYNRAYLTARSINSPRAQAIAIAMVGRILLRQGLPNRARPALEEAEQLTLSLPNRQGIIGLICEIYHDLMVTCIQQNDSNGALESAKKGLQAAQDSQGLVQLGLANRAMGELLTGLNTPPADMGDGFSTDPDVYFRAAMQYFTEMKTDLEIARTLWVYGESLAKRGHRMTGARKLQQAARIFTELNMLSEAALVGELQGKILTAAQ